MIISIILAMVGLTSSATPLTGSCSCCRFASRTEGGNLSVISDVVIPAWYEEEELCRCDWEGEESQCELLFTEGGDAGGGVAAHTPPHTQPRHQAEDDGEGETQTQDGQAGLVGHLLLQLLGIRGEAEVATRDG